jgi:phosphoribosylglycinamide formyltransferase-1
VSEHRCNVAVLASGYGSNFEALAEACRKADFPARVGCLISDNPESRALELARSLDIPAHEVVPPSKKASLPPDVEQEIVRICKSHDTDLIALAGFMRILKGPLIDAFEGRIMNIHPSLLPSFKGLHGIEQAMAYGAKYSGCTVHFVDRSVDGGPIILQAAVPIDDDDTLESLEAKVHRQEHDIYARAVELFARGNLKIDGRRVTLADSTR